MKNIFRIIIVFSIIFYQSAYGILPIREYRFYPEKMGLIYKDLDVITSDGLKIKTWFFPAQTKPSEKDLELMWKNPIKKTYTIIDNRKRPTVIIANGDTGNMSYQQLTYAQYLTNRGYNVVTFDWRGFGESSEWKMNTDFLVYTELLKDYDAVIKEVLKQDEVDLSKIAVFGWSTGAYLSMAASNKCDNIKCFVAIGLMTSFDETLPVLKSVPKNKDRNLIVPKDYPKELEPVNLALNYRKATFLIVGENDDRTPSWMSEKIYSILPKKKDLWIVQGAGHTIIIDNKIWDTLNERIVAFLDNNLNE